MNLSLLVVTFKRFCFWFPSKNLTSQIYLKFIHDRRNSDCSSACKWTFSQSLTFLVSSSLNTNELRIYFVYDLGKTINRIKSVVTLCTQKSEFVALRNFRPIFPDCADLTSVEITSTECLEPNLLVNSASQLCQSKVFYGFLTPTCDRIRIGINQSTYNA